MHGTQPGEPPKAAAAIAAALTSAQTPLRLPLGADAVEAIRTHAQSLLADIARWERVASDTRIDEARKETGGAREMRRIIAITQITVDGIMQGPGGPEEDPTGGFALGGWAMMFGDDTLHQVISDTMAGAFDMLLGRRTYDIFAQYWPDKSGVIAEAFNKATKYVATHTLDRLAWKNSQPLRGDAVEEVRRLRASDGPELHVWGSSALLQALIAADLVDEYRFWMSPVVLGKGKRLFQNGVPPRVLTLVETRSTSTGVLINTYRPVGPLPAM